jgi:DNA topoisomerase-1
MEILGPNDSLYKHTIEIPKFKGFMEDDDQRENLDIFTSMSMRRFQPSTVVNYNYIQSIAKVAKRHSRYSEASLIRQMEDLGIGRPSTFSLLVEVIQSRKYVEKTHIVGTPVECVEHVLSTSVTEKRVTKTFGNEQNKLVINRTGNTTIEFLTKHFDNLFSYNYTKQMEERLDLIAAGNEVWYTVCDDCYKEIKRQKKTIEKPEVVTPVIRVLGTWEEHEVTLKSGAYGNYLEYNGTTISLTDVKKGFSEIVLEDVVSCLENKNVIVTLTPSLSIRNSKYGPYIFYKTDKMKKPKFFDLKGKDPSSDDLLEWITNRYLSNKKKI